MNLVRFKKEINQLEVFGLASVNVRIVSLTSFISGFAIYNPRDANVPAIPIGIVSYPSSTSTVKIEIIRGNVDDFIALLGHFSGIGRRYPDTGSSTLASISKHMMFLECLQDDGVIGKSNAMVQNHLLPDNRSLSGTYNGLMSLLSERAEGLVKC